MATDVFSKWLMGARIECGLNVGNSIDGRFALGIGCYRRGGSLKMRILMVDRVPPGLSMQTHAINLVEHLVKRGMDLEVLHIERWMQMRTRGSNPLTRRCLAPFIVA